MRFLWRLAVGAAAVALGASALAAPVAVAQASVHAPARPGAVPHVAYELLHPRPGEHVARDKRGRVLLYVEGKRVSALRRAVAKVGGVVTAAEPGRVRAAVPAAQIAALGTQPGVAEVRRPTAVVSQGIITKADIAAARAKARRAAGSLSGQNLVNGRRAGQGAVGVTPNIITSEGVAASGADKWIAAGDTGSGVKVGIIDDGFGGLAAAQADGELPAGSQITINNANCEDATTFDTHGTAVAEVVHAMAPGASLYLACISDDMGFGPAVTWLQQQGVQVIDAGISIPGSGRGDGSGGAGSPAQVVQASNKAGTFWAVAAGNYAHLHFGGDARAEANGFVDFSQNAQANGFNVAANNLATVTLRWDAWPLTTTELDLYIMKNPVPPTGPTDPNIVASSTIPTATTPGGGSPVQEVQFTNTAATAQTYYVYIKNINAPFTMPFDLFVSAGGATQLQYNTPAGSVTEPATSPYVMAVGATQPGSGALEDYSSQGPTIDGRAKPDITGFDKVSTFTYGFQGFAGTEAASAHVAGAAALLKSANPQLDPAEIYSTLAGRATPVTGGSADAWGAGVLTMGPPGSAPAPATSGYTPLPDPQRVLDTAANIGGHNTPFAPGEVFTLPLSVPGDTTAVAITLSATSDSATSVGVFPTNQAAAAGNRDTTLQVQPGQVGASVTAIVPVGPDRAIRIVNSAGHTNIGVDLLGYFDPAGAGAYFPLAQPVRVLDTRGPANGAPNTQARGHLSQGAVDTVQLEGSSSCQPWPSPCAPTQPLPANATAAVVNVTAVEAAGTADLAVYANSRSTPTQALSVGVGERKSNLMIVPLGAGGTIKITDLSAASVNVIVDVYGWFAPGQGGRYVPLAQATRIVDTATGTGLRQGPLGQGEANAFDVAGLAGVSSQATAAVLNVTGSDDAQATQLSVSSHDVGFDPVTSIGMGEAQGVAGLAMPPLGASGQVDIRNETGSARIQADVEGYFLGGQQIPAGSGDCVTPMNEAGYSSLFDGRLETGLEGWQFVGVGQVDNSTAVVSQNGCDLKTVTGNHDIAWYGAHTYGNDYTLELDWQATTANSGAGVLVDLPNPQENSTTAAADALDVVIGPNSATGPAQTGSIAGLQAPTSVPVNPVGQWNTFKITVSWNTVTVALNGQQVNRYTITDPTKINVPSFIGLQNSGGNDPVLFRDIRIERNTQALSGRIQANANVFPRPCLDLANNAATPGNTFRLDACNGGMSQNFTLTSDGRIQVANGCLDASSGSVVFDPCDDGTGQQWVADGTIANVLTKKCLSGSITAGVGLAVCGAGSSGGLPTESWLLPTQQGGTAASYVTAGNTCLTVQNAVSANGAPVQVAGCDGDIGQQWTAPGDGTLRAVGGCLDLANGATAAGTAIQLNTCTAGNADQQWLPQADGTMVNPVSGRCLTAPSGGSITTATIQDCTGTPQQAWAATAQFAWRGQINGPAGLCLEVTGGNPSSNAVSLVSCSPAAGTNWTAYPDGTIRAFGKCLDVAGAGTANNTAVDLAACNGSAAQVWVQRPDGALANPASDRVLNDPNGAPASGDPVQIYDDIEPFFSVPANCSQLTPGQALSPGQSITSCDGRFNLILQNDGNLVLYHLGYPGVAPMWATGTTGKGTTVAKMQTDGNFVLYDAAGDALWASGTGGHPGAFLALQTDGNLIVYDSTGKPLWTSGTGGHNVFAERWALSALPG